MARDFTIQVDNSRLTGEISGTTYNLPIIQQVNCVPTIKNINSPYALVNGDKKT